MRNIGFMRVPRRHILRDILRDKVKDDRFLDIFADFARLIGTTIKLFERNDDFPEHSAEEITYYTEELLGLSFVLLQAKIRRVEARAKLLGFSDARALDGLYKNTNTSFVSLIWELANYYKHHDDWGSEEWSDERLDHTTFSRADRSRIERGRQTRRIIEKVGIKRRSTCNMRTAYDFFEIDWASNCTQLAVKMQEWVNAVYEKSANR